MKEPVLSVFMDPAEAEEFKRRWRLREAWGTHLDGLQWDHFVTLTFRFPPSEDQTTRDLRRWTRWMEQQAQRKVRYFKIAEFDAGGERHVHLLVKGTGDLDPSALRNAWRSGISDVQVYDPKKGPGFYLAKQLGVRTDEYALEYPPLRSEGLHGDQDPSEDASGR